MPTLDDRVAFDLAEIFQYDIDFVLDIQADDRFTVVYEEVFQDGTSLRTGKILAAKFVNEGREYRAVRYVDAAGPRRVLHAGRQEPAQGIHTRAGAVLAHQLALQSLAPPPGAEHHPRAQGVDYAAPVGTPVRAAGDGRVRFVGRQGGYGNVIELEHGSGVVTVYGHLSRFASNCIADNTSTSGRSLLTSVRRASRPARTCTTNTGSAACTRIPQTVPLPDAAPIPARRTGALPDRHGRPGEHAGFAGGAASSSPAER